MMTFVRFHEYNDHEGEGWNWWLQLTGNEDEISKFAELLLEEERKRDYDLSYTLHPEDVEPEPVVDILVRYAKAGYNDSDNKVTGKFECPDDLGEDADRLYKGGVNSFFEDEKSACGSGCR